MRITIDTREDSYEDALGVLRRAYGRHRLPRKAEESRGAGRLERRRRSGEGTGQPVRFRWSQGRGLEEGDLREGAGGLLPSEPLQPRPPP